LHSNVNAYQGDSPADYLVEPSDYVSPEAPALAQIRNRYDIWTKQEHDLHSNVNAYQGDSDPNYVVEPTAEANLHNPPTLAQIRRRTLPDVPHTNPGGNHVTNGGDAIVGMEGEEAHGEAVTVGGSAINFAHRRTLPDEPHTNPGGNHVTNGGHSVVGMEGEEAHGEAVTVGGSAINFLHQRY
jgi:hypothetical protein